MTPSRQGTLRDNNTPSPPRSLISSNDSNRSQDRPSIYIRSESRQGSQSTSRRQQPRSRSRSRSKLGFRRMKYVDEIGTIETRKQKKQRELQEKLQEEIDRARQVIVEIPVTPSQKRYPVTTLQKRYRLKEDGSPIWNTTSWPFLLKIPDSVSRENTPVSQQRRPPSVTPSREIPLQISNGSWVNKKSGKPVRPLSRKGSGKTQSSSIDTSERRRGISLTPSGQGTLRENTPSPSRSGINSDDSNRSQDRPSIYIRSESRQGSQSTNRRQQPRSRSRSSSASTYNPSPTFQAQGGIAVNGQIRGVRLTVLFSTIHRYNFMSISTAQRCGLTMTSNSNNQTEYSRTSISARTWGPITHVHLGRVCT